MAYWEARCHEFGDVYVGWCPAVELRRGYVIIDAMPPLFVSEPTDLAATAVPKEGPINAAYIGISRDSLWLLVHELGHALGYDHADEPGHILYPTLTGGGLRDGGLSVCDE